MDGAILIEKKSFNRLEKLDALKSWASDNKIELNNCEIKIGDSDGAGLYATADITEDNASVPFVKVPLNSVLMRRSIFALAKGNEFFRNLLFRKADGTKIATEEFHLDDGNADLSADTNSNEFYNTFPLSNKDILVRFFIFEILTSRRGGPKDLWTTWVESLPPMREMKLPFSWERDDIQELYGSSIYEAVLSKLEFLKYRYNRLFEDKKLREEIAEYVQSGPSPQINLEADLELTFQDWLLIESWICSRSLEVLDRPLPDVKEASPDGLRTGLVPVVDLCNHEEVEWNAKYDFDLSTGAVTLIPIKEIKKGDQIYITYGEEKGAGEMLFTYGFIPDGNPLGHAKVASFVVPPVIDEDVDEKEPIVDEDDATMVIRAKNKMFGTRTRLFRVSQFEPSKPVEWKSDYISFLALPAEAFTFDNSNSEDDSKPTSILFHGTAIDLGDVSGSLESVLTGQVGEAVSHNAKYMAEMLVSGVFIEGLYEKENAQKEESGTSTVSIQTHPLIKLERKLLESLAF